MAAIPTPFVGGGLGGSGLDSTPPLSWAPPYWPAIEPRPTSDTTVEEVIEDTDGSGFESETEAVVEGPEAEAEPASELAAEGVATADPETVDPEAAQAAEPDVEAAIEPVVEPAAEATLEPATVTEEEPDAAAEALSEPEDFDYPDYLFGPDAEGRAPAASAVDKTAMETPDERVGHQRTEAGALEGADADRIAAAGEPVDRDELQTVIRRLLDGPDGDRIRRLAGELTGLSPEEAVARAFAAGYLSGRAKSDE